MSWDVEVGYVVAIPVVSSVENFVIHCVDGDGVNSMLRSFWISEFEGNSEGEVEACEWDEVEPDGCEERLEAQVCEASTLVQIVPILPAEVDVVRLSFEELCFLFAFFTLRLVAISLVSFNVMFGFAAGSDLDLQNFFEFHLVLPYDSVLFNLQLSIWH